MARALVSELKRASARKTVEQDMKLSSSVTKQVKQVRTKPFCFMLNVTVLCHLFQTLKLKPCAYLHVAKCRIRSRQFDCLMKFPPRLFSLSRANQSQG